MTIGERVAYYRRRRGLSQVALAGLAGRTESWVQKIENGRAELDRLSVIAIVARALDVAVSELLPDDVASVDDSNRGRSVPTLRDLIFRYQALRPDPDPQQAVPLTALTQQVDEIWVAYQASQFPYVIARLNDVLPIAHASLIAAEGSDKGDAAVQSAYLYHAAASVLVKIGETDLAGRCAERGLMMTDGAGDDVARSSLDRSVAHTLLSSGLFEDAVGAVHQSLSQPSGHDARSTSTAGSLMLVGAMAAARSGSRIEATAFLRHAERAANSIGRDANHVWTAFGPTNVAIHRVAVAGELGDMQLAAHIGSTLNVASMPRERQARHKLEVARALARTAKTDDALRTVLGAERLAPEQVRRHFLTHELVHEWMRSRRRPNLELLQLSARLGHAA